jgi:hypothetical protein
MRRKIVIEISQNESQIPQFAKTPNPLFRTIAAASPERRLLPREFPGGCDKFGGWKTSVN